MNGQPFGVRLEQVTGNRVKAWGFDPRTGQTTAAGQFARAGEREFIPHGEQNGNPPALPEYPRPPRARDVWQNRPVRYCHALMMPYARVS